MASKVDPVFMPAMAKAGTIRMVVLALRDPGLRTVPNDVNQVNNICDVLTGMIAPVKQDVDQAHKVELKSHELHTAHPGDTGPLIIPDGYFHEEHGRVLEFFSAHGARDFDDPRLDKAAQQAENARQAGVDAELEFLGVPVFEGLVQQWRSLVDKPLVTIPIVTGVGNRAATA